MAASLVAEIAEVLSPSIVPGVASARAVKN